MELARLSGRACWEEYTISYEGRPLGQLIISLSENIKNIEQIRIRHIALSDPAASDRQNIKEMPMFVKLGYGVHGNESGAQNASAVVAYYMIAGEGPKIDNILKNNVILIDPSLNPDGMQHHSTWVNSMRSLNDNPDPNSREFSEPCPGLCRAPFSGPGLTLCIPSARAIRGICFRYSSRALWQQSPIRIFTIITISGLSGTVRTEYS